MKYESSSDFLRRFWGRVVQTQECWLWKGRRDGAYGVVQAGNEPESAHRVAYQIASGHKIPDGIYVCHRCDTPRCVNPSHLFLGTPSDNMRDKEAKGRGNHRTSPVRVRFKRHTVSCPFVTQADAAKLIGVPRQYIPGMVARGELVGRTDVVEGMLLVTKASAEAAAERRQQEKPAA